MNPTLTSADATPIPLPDRVEVVPGAFDRALSDSTKMLLALSRKPGHMYEGTVPAAVKARRRAKNKAARHARRVCRG